MLSKNERNLLKLAKKSKENRIKYSIAKEKLAISFDDVKSAANGLIGRGLAEEKTNYTMQNSLVPWGIVLSEKGRHRFRYALEGLGAFMFRSILIPVIVAFLTSLITIWLSSFFN